VTVLALSLGLGCAIDQAIDRTKHTDTFLQEPKADVDILWVIDNSSSMESEQAAIAAGFDTFVAGLEETNIDFHIGVTTTNMDLDNGERASLIGDPIFLTRDDDYIALFEDRVTVGIEGSDKEKGLQAALDALTEPRASGANSGFLRDDADLSIIYVSDEDDCSDGEALADMDGAACYSEEDSLVPVRDFIASYRDLKDGDNGVFASAIVGPDVSDHCAETWPGHRYQTVAKALAGVIGNICETDFAGIMDELGLAVSGVLNVFQLELTPVVDTIEVAVDDEQVFESATDGWTYDEEYNSIRFDGSYVPERGTTVSVAYEIAGE